MLPIAQLKRKELPPLAAFLDPLPIPEDSSAEQLFVAASILDDGEPANFDEAASAYGRALEIDPYLVPALINLANIHYGRTRSSRGRRCTIGGGARAGQSHDARPHWKAYQHLAPNGERVDLAREFSD